MNKKQLMVAWGAGIIISVICLYSPGGGIYGDSQFDLLIKRTFYIIPVITVTVLLMLTLGTKNPK